MLVLLGLELSKVRLKSVFKKIMVIVKMCNLLLKQSIGLKDLILNTVNSKSSVGL